MFKSINQMFYCISLKTFTIEYKLILVGSVNYYLYETGIYIQILALEFHQEYTFDVQMAYTIALERFNRIR